MDLNNLTFENLTENGFIILNKDSSEPTVFYAKKLERYGEFPELPKIEGLIIMTFEEIQDFYNSVLSSRKYIHFINGLQINGYTSYYCDYCSDDIKDESTYYYCMTCHQDMCDECYDEKRTRVNRYDLSVKYCIENHELFERNFSHRVYCDTCGKPINDDQKFANKPQLRYGENTHDVCMKCSSEEIGKEAIETHGLVKMNNFLPCTECGFGNFLDWVPIYRDNKTRFLFVNLNINSPNYQRTALSAYKYEYSNTVSIYMLADKLKGLLKKIMFSSEYDFMELGENDGSDDEWNESRDRHDQTNNSIIYNIYRTVICGRGQDTRGIAINTNVVS